MVIVLKDSQRCVSLTVTYASSAQVKKQQQQTMGTAMKESVYGWYPPARSVWEANVRNKTSPYGTF
jgi:hypothetical protein